eukprot:4944194-Pleurochrysis_carterae.AAC.2
MIAMCLLDELCTDTRLHGYIHHRHSALWMKRCSDQLQDAADSPLGASCAAQTGRRQARAGQA